MSDVVLEHFGRILRYFAAPVVGIGTVHFLDTSNSVLSSLVTIAHTGDPPEPVISWWPLTIFTLVFGVLLYHAHRTLFHIWFNYCNIWVITRFRKLKVTALELDLARYCRESSGPKQPEHVFQARLNDYNAGCHFLWCSAWSVWLVPVILSEKFPAVAIGEMWYDYLVVFISLFLVAFISDVIASVFDCYAYEKYPNSRK